MPYLTLLQQKLPSIRCQKSAVSSIAIVQPHCETRSYMWSVSTGNQTYRNSQVQSYHQKMPPGTHTSHKRYCANLMGRSWFALWIKRLFKISTHHLWLMRSRGQFLCHSRSCCTCTTLLPRTPVSRPSNQPHIRASEMKGKPGSTN